MSPHKLLVPTSFLLSESNTRCVTTLTCIFIEAIVGSIPNSCQAFLRNSPLTDGEATSCSGVDGRLHLPVDFLHPTVTALQQTGAGAGIREPSRLTSPTSWTSLCLSEANSRLCQQPSASDSSLASSDGSVRTTMEEGLSISLTCDLNSPLPPLVKQHSATFDLQARRGHQRSHSSCGASRGCPRWHPADPSADNAVTGAVADSCCHTLHSEHFNSLSLTSLLSPASPPPPLIKKCNSTGSLGHTKASARNNELRGVDAKVCLSNPRRVGGGERDNGVTGLSTKSQSKDPSYKRNR
ncbi:voltage-dependent T-type calcium channel subunit alpha-1I-like [Synchiropus picturatus]